MDFMDAVRLLWRRRLIVLAGILLTGLACAAVIVQVQTVYQSTGQYLLVLPADAGGKKNLQNPLINQPTGLIIAAGLVAAEVNTPEAQREMEDDGFEADSSLALAPDNGALLTIEVNDTDPAETLAKRDEIIRRLDAELERIQTESIPGIPDNQMIGSAIFAAGDEAEAVPGAKIRALVVVVAVGAVLTLLAAFGLDRPLNARRRRKEERAAAARRNDDDHDTGTRREEEDVPAPRVEADTGRRMSREEPDPPEPQQEPVRLAQRQPRRRR